MSMLAGPRRKQKVINLRAKNNAWSNDASKFGQRMLEKMGWTSGKGLGAKEDGIVQHVVARYKNDEKGLGFEDRNDQWTKHEDDFNALLANLSHATNDDDKMHSGISLEDKSKKSKTRIHYQKYTRGKDLSRYSEKDIANIFGKKSLKEVEKEIDEITEENSKTTEQIFTEKGSMIDYFKNKMSALQGQKLAQEDILDIENNCQGYHSDAENNHRGFGFSAEINDFSENENTYTGFGYHPATVDTPGFGFSAEINDFSENENTYTGFGYHPATVDTPNDAQQPYTINDDNLENSKKNKQRMKTKQDSIDGNISKGDINKIESNDNNNVHLMKRKKKKLIQNTNTNENTHIEIINVETTHEVKSEDVLLQKKKKKSKKNKTECKENDELEIDPCDQSNESALINMNNDGTQSTKEKKRKKKKNSERGVLYETEDIAPKKKKKKNR